MTFNASTSVNTTCQLTCPDCGHVSVESMPTDAMSFPMQIGRRRLLLLARPDANPYSAAVRQFFISLVVLLLLAGNVAAAMHAHASAAGAGVLELTADDGSGTGESWPSPCESCAHGLSYAVDVQPMATKQVFAVRRLALPPNSRSTASWQGWPADKPPKSAIPD